MTANNPDREFLLKQLKYDRRIVRAKGHYLYDSQGRACLDFVAQLGAVPFGHNPDELWDVVRRVAANDEPCLIQPFVSSASEALAQALIAASPIKKGHVTFANSGAEAVEVAIKLSRASTRRRTILATANGFHGKTLGAVSATGNSIYREPFLVDTTHFAHIAYGDLDALAERLKQGDVAAFIVEPVQGEAGMITPPEGYLTAAAAECRKHGTLFVLDEVQTGLGRTGRLFAAEHDRAVPDVLLLAKALGGGLVSLAACLCAEHAWTRDFGNYHSSTFANNHLACSIGLATLQRLCQGEQALIRDVADKAAYLRTGLERLVKKHGSAFASVDGRGLMQGLEIRPWHKYDSYFLSHATFVGLAVPLFCAHLLNEHDIVTVPTLNRNNVIRIQPSLTITRPEIDRLLTALEATAQILENGDFVNFFRFVTGKGQAPKIARTPANASEPIAVNGMAARQAPARPLHAVNGEPARLGRFAFLIHYTELDDILFGGPRELADLEDEPRERWVDWLQSWSIRRHDPGVVCHIPILRSAMGGHAEGWLIAAPLLPRQMIRLPQRDRDKLIGDYLEIAADLGADMVGLGAFTSVVTRNGSDIADRGLNVTTGNSLTACVSAESLKSAIRAQGSDIGKMAIGVIGAAGSVGRLACLDLVREAGRMTLFGNPSNAAATQRLKQLAGELYREALLAHVHGSFSPIGDAVAHAVRGNAAIPAVLVANAGTDAFLQLYHQVESVFEANGRRPPISVTVELAAHLPGMDAVISATSQGNGFVEPALFASRTIICDVARPPDILKRVAEQRPDILIYEGGLVAFPEKISFGRRNVIGTPPGVNLACLAETAVLTMSGIRRNFSIGERPPIDDAREVFRLALQHGFRIPPLPSAIRSVSAPLPFADAPAEAASIALP